MSGRGEQGWEIVSNNRPWWLKASVAWLLSGVVLVAGVLAWANRLEQDALEQTPPTSTVEPGSEEQTTGEGRRRRACTGAHELEDVLVGQSVQGRVPNASESPTHLAAQSSRVVSGTIDSVSQSDEHLVVSVQMEEELTGIGGPDVTAFSVWNGNDPATVLPDVEGLDFVAFLQHSTTVPGGLSPEPEGFWVGCGTNSRAIPIPHSHPAGDWPTGAQATLSSLALSIEEGQDRVTKLASVRFDDGSLLIPMHLLDDSVFTVRLPPALAGSVALSERAVGDEVAQLHGDEFVAALEVGYCSAEILQEGAANILGTFVNATDPARTRACLPDHFVTLDIQHAAGALTSDDLNQIQILAVRKGSHYSRLVTEDGPECCQRVGPVATQGKIVVSNGFLDGTVTAVDSQTLAPVWRTDVGGSSFLHGAVQEGTPIVLASNARGRLMGLDATTGAIAWEVATPDEVVSSVILHGSAALVTMEARGQGHAPRVRSIDLTTGDVRWEGQGFPGTVWQWGEPVVFDDQMVLLDVPRRESEATTASLLSFDVDTGELTWTLGLQSPGEVYGYGLLVSDSTAEEPLLLVTTVTGHAVRVNSSDGTEMWRSVIGSGRVISLGADTVTLRRGTRVLELDLETGERR